MISQNAAVLAAALPIAGFASYLRDTVRGKAQPNQVSWLLWAVAPLIAGTAELAQGISPRVALVTLALGAGPLLVVMAALASPAPRPERRAAPVSTGRNLPRGHRTDRASRWMRFRLDLACGGISVIALAAWAVSGQGELAIALSIAADLAAAVPTIIKSWISPASETTTTYLASGAAGAITLLAVPHWTFASCGFPLYIMIVCGLITALIWLSPRQPRRHVLPAGGRRRSRDGHSQPGYAPPQAYTAGRPQRR